MFREIVINRENLQKITVSLSSPREGEDSSGNKFRYYWINLNGMLCCTGKKFCELLGEDADDKKAASVIKDHEGEFRICQATDKDGDPIYIQDDLDKPLLKIQAVAHSVTVEWW